MSVPGFQTWFLPLLTRLADGEEHKIADLYEQLADDLMLSPADRSETLQSGRQFTYQNRIGWARTYLKKAGLLESPERAVVRITELGKQVLANPPEKLNVRYLRTYPAFVKFHSPGSDATGDAELSKSGGDSGETPLDTMERVSRLLRADLAQELLEKVKVVHPSFFEKLVLDLLVGMGFGGSHEDAAKNVGKSGDGGVDGIINEDPLGLDTVCIQAKRWENTVGRPVVQAFAGSLEGFRARKGVMMTTASFSKEAHEYVTQIEKKIVLIEGKQIAELMIQYGIGVSIETTYEIKKLDSDYFDT